MPESDLKLTWLLDDDQQDPHGTNLLAIYFREIANGPLTDYRSIIQTGQKQGQNYYTHVLDGISALHKLRTAGVIVMDDIEEMLLFAADTIHDLNKIPPYGGRDVKSSYSNIATCQNIATELQRIDMQRFFYDWKEYLEDIRLLMLLHQHDTAPLDDLDLRKHAYKLRYERLLELGKLLYAVDNLNLSHTLAERNHKENFLATINAVSEKRWRWVTHRLGENRAVLSNIIHNNVVSYLKERYTHDERSNIADLLYYPDGVAYLLPEREAFTWSEDDTKQVAQRLAQAIVDKQAAGLQQFIIVNQLGIRVSRAGIDSGVSYTEIMYAIHRAVDRKRYSATWHATYSTKLTADIEQAASSTDQTIRTLAVDLLQTSQPIVPLESEALKKGDLALAYYNLLHDHLENELIAKHNCNAWGRVYTLLNLPSERYALYEQVNAYRRSYFIARDCTESLETIFEHLLADVADLAGEQTQKAPDGHEFCDYLALNLECGAANYTRSFSEHLQHYVKANHKQCCMCSSALPSIKLMDSDVPNSMGVQVFSNRLSGGGGEPKRNICPLCRTQLILEKLTRVAFKKGKEQYTSFYLHLYPYAFFTSSYIDAMYSTLKNVCHEENQCFFLDRGRYFRHWEAQFAQGLSSQAIKQARRMLPDEDVNTFAPHSTKLNGISVPQFSDTVCNTPTLPINAPGDNYSLQFLFALTHALMIADFFGCRVALSRTPIPLLSSEYMVEHALAFFADGIPLNLRWLLPTNEYRSIETYRDRQDDGGPAYRERINQWPNESPDAQGYAAYENIAWRLSTLYRLAQQLSLSPEDTEAFLLEIAMSMADDPFSAYRVVDLTIEKQLKHVGTSNTSRGKKAGTKNSMKMPPEQLAIYLSKRVAPLLAEIIKE